MATKKVDREPLARTQYHPHERILQNPGSPERILYQSKLQDDGTIALIPSGKEDLYASIQSHKDSCDIHVLLARYQNGDPEALSRVQGVYTDVIGMPKSYAELLNAVISGRQYFDSLPKEVKDRFDQSFEKFMVSMDDMSSFLDKLGVTQQPDPQSDPSPASEPAPEVKE